MAPSRTQQSKTNTAGHKSSSQFVWDRAVDIGRLTYPVDPAPVATTGSIPSYVKPKAIQEFNRGYGSARQAVLRMFPEGMLEVKTNIFGQVDWSATQKMLVDAVAALPIQSPAVKARAGAEISFKSQQQFSASFGVSLAARISLNEVLAHIVGRQNGLQTAVEYLFQLSSQADQSERAGGRGFTPDGTIVLTHRGATETIVSFLVINEVTEI